MNVKELVEEYTDNSSFELVAQNNNSFTIEGEYKLFAEYNDIILADDYALRIVISNNYPSEIPIVYELSGKIPSKYPHISADRALCLGIRGDIACELEREPSLASFVETTVQSALYSAKFFFKYGKYPFGERKHGAKGILSYYEDLFEADQATSLKLLRTIALDQYRGHSYCPCGSSQRLRDCHGKTLLSIMRSPVRHAAAKRDYEDIVKELKVLKSAQRKPALFQPSME